MFVVLVAMFVVFVAMFVVLVAMFVVFVPMFVVLVATFVVFVAMFVVLVPMLAFAVVSPASSVVTRVTLPAIFLSRRTNASSHLACRLLQEGGTASRTHGRKQRYLGRRALSCPPCLCYGCHKSL